jgi:hypothetical protein
MAIRSRSPKPNEWAAKTNHTHIIQDDFVKDFLANCDLPPDNADAESFSEITHVVNKEIQNPIKHLLAVDGGYTAVEVKKNFPSSQIAFFQFGAVLFQVKDLEELSEKPFIFPEDMNKLHNLQRFKLALPIKNIKSKQQGSLKDSIRKTIYDFFMEKRDGERFIETLKWLVFEEYKDTPLDEYILGSDPNGGDGKVSLHRNAMKRDFTFDSREGTVYLTDVFRLYEVVDEDQGAGGILGYVTRLVEQLILVHFIKSIFQLQPSLLNEFLFIVDGPLSFSGQTANMHKPMRALMNHLQSKKNLFLVGIEKSGAFVDHAQLICLPNEEKTTLSKGQFILLSNEYIYKYIVPGDSKTMHYGSTSYYGGKVIYHSEDGQILVLTVPVPDKDVILSPKIHLYKNINEIILNMQKLRCDMYDDAVIPVALANKLVSLANHPSKVLLEKFAKAQINIKN